MDAEKGLRFRVPANVGGNALLVLDSICDAVSGDVPTYQLENGHLMCVFPDRGSALEGCEFLRTPL